LLTVKSLCVTYRMGETKRALEDVNFSMKRGEVLAIVGESGSGKSTLAQGLLRLFDFQRNVSVAGEIWFEGRQVFPDAQVDLKAYRGRSIGMVFQEPLLALNPLFKVGDQVSETLRHHFKLSKKAAKERVRQLFSELELDPDRYYRAFPFELSGGLRQRVMLAMAYVCQPQLVIADEPTSSLDAILRHKTMSFMVQKCENERSSLLLITHDMALAEQYANNIMVLYRGRLIEKGRTEQVLNNPQHWYTEKLISISHFYKERFTEHLNLTDDLSE